MERSRNAIVLMMGVPSRRFFDLSCFPAPVESLLPWCLEQGLWRHREGGRRGGPDHGLRQFEGPVVRGGVGGSSLGSFAGRLAALKSGATVTFPEGPAAQRYDGCMACPAQPGEYSLRLGWAGASRCVRQAHMRGGGFLYQRA